MTAFERLKRHYADGDKLRITADGCSELQGRVCIEHPTNVERVIVFVGQFTWFEFTAQSDIEFYGDRHLHIHGGAR